MFDNIGCDICKRDYKGSCANGQPYYLTLLEQESRGPCEPIIYPIKQIKICSDCYDKLDKKISKFFESLKR